MSVLSKIQGNSGNKKTWTPEQVKVAIGMKLQNAPIKDIGIATGHFSTNEDGTIVANTVTYVLSRRFTKKDPSDSSKLIPDDDKLNAFIGQTEDGRNYDVQDFIDYANNFLNSQVSESSEETA